MQSRTPTGAHRAGVAHMSADAGTERAPRGVDPGPQAQESGPSAGRRTIDAVLRDARSRYDRLTPVAAATLLAAGRVILVDTRPIGQRQADGEIPGAVVVDRNVLEWRLDPASASRLPFARYDLPVVVLCNQGYSSSLAVASLLDLGISRATDVVGGFEAWRAAGLPVLPTGAQA